MTVLKLSPEKMTMVASCTKACVLDRVKRMELDAGGEGLLLTSAVIAEMITVGVVGAMLAVEALGLEE